MRWKAGLSSSAIRDLDRLPPRVVPAVLEFIYDPLTENPRRVGKPLRDDFESEWSARRGSYRVLYRLDDTAYLITVSRVGHRANVLAMQLVEDVGRAGTRGRQLRRP